MNGLAQRLLEAPYALASLAAKASSEEELLNEIVASLRELCEAETCDILMRARSGALVLQASTHVPEYTGRLRLGKGIGLTGQALLNDEALFIEENAGRMPQFANYPGFDDQESEGMAILPLHPGKGSALGVLVVRRNTRWSFTEEEKRAFRRLARFLADSLIAMRRAQELGVRANPLGALSEVSKTISSSPYVEEILQLLVNLTAQQFNYRVCTVRLLDETRNELVLRATQSSVRAYQRKRAIKLGESIAGRVIRENRVVIVRDVGEEEEYIGHDLAAEQGLRSMICVPLTLQNRPVGVMTCYTDAVREFEDDEIKALETLAKQAAVSIEHAKLQVRTTLMQEMHHRVKNNLQQVASLLRLQMRQSNYKTLEEALNDCLARILAIASVHDLLSREDLDFVDVRSIAETLVQHQQSSLVLPDRKIAFQVEGESIWLNTTQGTQIALVLNELVMNAVEHGFAQAVSGRIRVWIEAEGGEVGLRVANDGDPLPEGFDMGTQSHLGLQIVENLVRAIGGRFTLASEEGWTLARVRFPRVGGE